MSAGNSKAHEARGKLTVIADNVKVRIKAIVAIFVLQ
jgi:hypothetical protein